MRRTLIVGISLILIAAHAAVAQKKHFTIDDLYDPKTRASFDATTITGAYWLDADRLAYAKKNTKGELEAHIVIDAATGAESVWLAPDRIERALRAADVAEEDAARSARSKSLLFNRDKSTTLFEINGRLYLFDVNRGTVLSVTTSAGASEEATFSPDGTRVAFVRGNDLFTSSSKDEGEVRLTTDGSEEILNGKLDWVYQEEIYGRGNFRGYWWSPDSSKIAFLRFDEHPVKEFAVVDHIPYLQDVEVTNYPKAGDPNPNVTLHVVGASGGIPLAIDLSRYRGQDILISNVDWSPDSSKIVFQIQDRTQTWLDLNAADPISGKVDFWFRETSKAWVEMIDNPTWLRDGSFLWQSERTGWRHLYHYSREGKLIRSVTSGRWEVRKVHGVDEKAKQVYISATARSPIDVDVYRIHLSGRDLKRLTERPGTHDAAFNPSLTRFVDRWSDMNTPPQLRVHRRDGREIRLLDANRVAALDAYELVKPELLQIKTRDGFVMEAMMLKPAAFDPSKKYPIYQHTYGGPHAPQVRNRWGATTYLFHQMLAQNGIVVFLVDNRTASGKGAESAWPVYRNFGELELRDLSDAITWLKTTPWVDENRIMLNGWSYGGFMVCYAMTNADIYKAGIAGGSVTDWRDYDTIYTERYMGLPQENEEGYRKSSPRWAAEKLHGNLLLIHGTLDDNVHLQNTIQFAYELQKAEKSFELMLYPKSRHGVTDPLLQKHMRQTMWNFIQRQLLNQ